MEPRRHEAIGRSALREIREEVVFLPTGDPGRPQVAANSWKSHDRICGGAFGDLSGLCLSGTSQLSDDEPCSQRML